MEIEHNERPMWDLLTDEAREAFKKVRRYKMVPVDEEVRCGYSIYCKNCGTMVPNEFRHGDICANCTMDRLIDERDAAEKRVVELEKQNARLESEAIIWNGMLNRRGSELLEAREVAKFLWSEGMDECWMKHDGCGGYARRQWPWLEEK